MISYLKGKLEYILNDYIIVDVNNIGFQVFISTYTMSELPQQGNEIKIYTYMNVREDAILLYGFLTMDEMNMFDILKTVSGVGPKSALGMLSFIRPQDISMAIITEDLNILSKAPGIGKKTAQRIILDLKDKLKTSTLFENNNDNITIDIDDSPNLHKKEAIEALISLGYSQMESTKVVIDIYKDNANTEDIIKLALKKISKF